MQTQNDTQTSSDQAVSDTPAASPEAPKASETVKPTQDAPKAPEVDGAAASKVADDEFIKNLIGAEVFASLQPIREKLGEDVYKSALVPLIKPGAESGMVKVKAEIEAETKRHIETMARLEGQRLMFAKAAGVSVAPTATASPTGKRKGEPVRTDFGDFDSVADACRAYQARFEPSKPINNVDSATGKRKPFNYNSYAKGRFTFEYLK